MKYEKSSIGLGLLTALASSLCCIAPILALLAGTSGVASNFSRIEPMRPYLVGATFLILGFAWYQKLKPQAQIADCCQTNVVQKNSFMHGKPFLGIVTVFALLLTTFPYYSTVFAASSKENAVKFVQIECVEFKINGMTCTGCEQHITGEVIKLTGIQSVKTSYADNNSRIEFDPKRINIHQIQEAIDSTGYQAEGYKFIKK
jgi:mercuric ion transport protein